MERYKFEDMKSSSLSLFQNKMKHHFIEHY